MAARRGSACHAGRLHERLAAPAQIRFAALECVTWAGATKDLRLASPRLGDALLLDDYGPYVHPGQEHLWVQMPLFGSPYPSEDDGHSFALRRLLQRVDDRDQPAIH